MGVTNGDRIRQMSNEELAESRIYFNYELNMYTPLGARGVYLKKEPAIQAEIEWLNKEFKV